MQGTTAIAKATAADGAALKPVIDRKLEKLNMLRKRVINESGRKAKRKKVPDQWEGPLRGGDRAYLRR